MKQTISFIAHPGLTPYVQRELTQRFNHDATQHDKLPLATTELDAETALRTTYLTQSARRVTLPITTASFNELEDITLPDHKHLQRLENTTYRVTCERHGSHDFNSVDVEQHVGGQLTDHNHTNIELQTPENTVHVIINDDHYQIGLDLTGCDLSKRQYKVFSSSDGINACLGHAFTQAANIGSDETIVNPFSRDGVIPIETALEHKGVSVNHYERSFKFEALNLIDFFELDDILDDADNNLAADNTTIHCYDRNFRNLKAQKKNAKIAGVDKHIEFSRFEPEYIDLKFGDFSVDLIYGRPKTPTRHFPEDKVRRVYHDLFRYGKYVLTEDGRMVFLTQDDELLLDMAEQFTLKETNRSTITYKHIDYDIITLQRKHPNALEATHL
jgi:23S rRNA G2445 N2-methylase RlmL